MVKIQRGYKTELKLNRAQLTACAQHAGAARWVYNWGLARKIAAYKETGKSPSYPSLDKELRTLKDVDPELAWLKGIASHARQSALRDLDTAYRNFFRRVKTGAAKPGFPKFKSKHASRASFRLYGSIHIWPNVIQLPVLGRLRLKEKGYLPTGDVKVLNATVSEKAGRWFVSVLVEEDAPEPSPATGPAVGVDLGIKSLATVSDGRTFDPPRALEKVEARLKRWQRRLARRKRYTGEDKKKAQ